MFVPAPYRQPAEGWMAELLSRAPLALLTTNGPAAKGPYATHVPIIPDPALGGEWADDLSGALLLGHMNRANPHWKTLEAGVPTLLTFTGPHAYVSPTTYQVTPSVPTWNFTSAHVHGTLHPIDSSDETLHVVSSTARIFEAEFGTGWDMSTSIDQFRRILPGVGAFRVVVSHAEGMFKLSQEKSPEVRERVRRYFAQCQSSQRREVAELMSHLPEEASHD
ncbi:FMN-binding negative transcriptional regulator [Streptomyces sp. C184]|uniref:FMN-binding negative transcriptional regulator n=1 Tax=Streptomyces sp. C184 TaxID=3237121 RepID=UPI0034C68665